MDDMSMSIFQALTSYGALGAVAVYFMVKDWTLNREIEAALNEFKIALETLIKVVDN